jgi:tRNA(Glu) U13 pseudouridine synthase TruD
MKKAVILAVALMVGLTAYNTWQIRRLASIVDRRRAEAAAAPRLERALEHTRRARQLLSQNDTRGASDELDVAIREVSVAAARSRLSGSALVRSVQQGVSRAGQRVREALRSKKREKA